MPPNRFYSNTAQESALSSGINNSATSIAVTGVSGFPSSYPFTLIIDPDTASEEAINVTNVAGTTLTAARGQDNTVAVSHDAGAKVIHAHTARDFAEPQNHLGASSAVHGVAGNVVGTSDSQALSNKDLSAGTNIFPTSLATLTGSQTLTNKNMTSGTNTFPTSLVTLTGSQTLTNKTIQDPVYSIEGKTAEGVITCTSSTRPSHREGRMIYETDTDLLLKSTGTSWVSHSNLQAGLVFWYPAAVTGGGVINFGTVIKADGTDLNRTTFARLFAAWGTTHGNGDGSTTFGTVDLRGRTPFGVGGDLTLAENDGKAEADRGVRHTHNVSMSANHTHPINSTNHTGISNTATGGSADRVTSINGTVGGSHAHGGDTQGAGAHDHGGATGNGNPDPFGFSAGHFVILI